MLKFSRAEKQVGEKLYKKFVGLKKESTAPLISFDGLFGLLNREEKILIDKICSANPRDYGKSFTIFFGIKPAPKNLVVLAGQKYLLTKYNKIKTVKTQYLPEPVAKKFFKMKEAMRKDLGTTINVVSGYRSPAFQAVMLLIVLFENKWSMQKTLKRLTLPGCSEHGYPPRQAMDVAPDQGIENLKHFDKTAEYKWLRKNARRFGFAMSFPKNNKFGVMFEPWHWHYVKK